MFSPRLSAALALSAILDEGAYSSLYIDRVLGKLPADTPERDKRLFTGIVYAALEHLPSIDHVIRAYSNIRLPKMPALVRSALRIALAQILYMDKIPASAAISESVEIVKKSKVRNLASFTNAVLRSADRAGYAAPLPDPEKDLTAYLSIAYDMPVDITADYLAAYDRATAEKILSLCRGEKPLAVRTNTVKITPEALFARLSADEKVTDLRPGLSGTGVFFLRCAGNFADWDLYKEGLLYAQDESSVLAALAADARPGMKVLDLCAAPGGKTAVMAQCMENRGDIVSRDLHPHRVALIEENMARLGISIVTAEAADGTDPDSVPAAYFDRVVLDAPCSGLGVVRGKPDIKYHRADNDPAVLCEVQKKLLETAAKAVRPGGRLIYSTCTLLPRENGEQVESFLASHPEFMLVDAEEVLPMLKECDKIAKSYITLFPQEKGRDGFFTAVMEKTEKDLQ